MATLSRTTTQVPRTTSTARPHKSPLLTPKMLLYFFTHYRVRRIDVHVPSGQVRLSLITRSDSQRVTFFHIEDEHRLMDWLLRHAELTQDTGIKFHSPVEEETTVASTDVDDWRHASEDDVAVYQDARTEAEQDLAGRNAAWSTQYSLDDGSGNIGFEIRDTYSTTCWYESNDTAWLVDQVDRCFRSFPPQGYSTEVLYRWRLSDDTHVVAVRRSNSSD